MKKLMLLLTCCLLLAPCAMAEIDTRTDEQVPFMRGVTFILKARCQRC